MERERDSSPHDCDRLLRRLGLVDERLERLDHRITIVVVEADGTPGDLQLAPEGGGDIAERDAGLEMRTGIVEALAGGGDHAPSSPSDEPGEIAGVGMLERGRGEPVTALVVGGDEVDGAHHRERLGLQRSSAVPSFGHAARGVRHFRPGPGRAVERQEDPVRPGTGVVVVQTPLDRSKAQREPAPDPGEQIVGEAGGALDEHLVGDGDHRIHERLVGLVVFPGLVEAFERERTDGIEEPVGGPTLGTGPGVE